MRTITSEIVHHSATPRDLAKNKTITSFNKTHKERLHAKKNKLGYHIAYHYLIFSDGEILQTRGIDEIGYHASNWEVNKESISVCLIGNFDEEKPTEAQLNSLKKLSLELKEKYKLKNVFGHRHIISYKSCPGINISDEFIYTLFNNKEEMDEFKIYKEYLRENAKCNNHNWDKAFTKQEYAKMEYNLNTPTTFKAEVVRHISSLVVNLIAMAGITAGVFYLSKYLATEPVSLLLSSTIGIAAVVGLESGDKSSLQSLATKMFNKFIK